MTDIVDELAKVIAQTYGVTGIYQSHTQLAQAVLDSGLVVSRKHHDKVVDVHESVVNSLFAERDEARAALERVGKLADRWLSLAPTTTDDDLANSLNDAANAIRRAIEGEASDD